MTTTATPPRADDLDGLWSQAATRATLALEQAILRTLLYADTFNFPMTLAEIHHFLIGYRALLTDVAVALRCSSWLREVVEEHEGLYMLRGRGALLTERTTRDAASQSILPTAWRYGRLIGGLPFVRMVALTGALAMHNAHHAQDDIDYLVVTRAGRVWLTRAMIIAVVRVAAMRGVGLCPNYVLAETAVAQQNQDLYVAHEIAQMIPISGLRLYAQMRAANAWAGAHLPNADGPFYPAPAMRLGPIARAGSATARALKRIGELALAGPLGNRLERWEQRRKLRKFAAQMATPGSAAQLDGAQVKGHFNDYGQGALRRYQERLVEYGLALPQPPPGERMNQP